MLVKIYVTKNLLFLFTINNQCLSVGEEILKTEMKCVFNLDPLHSFGNI
jgi:hypothetical protein